MKVLVNIDQRAAIAEGIDAPHSTQTIDVDPALIPADLRPLFAEFYDIKAGSAEVSTYVGSELFRVNPKIIPPVTPERFVEAWATGARRLLASRAAHQAARQARDDEENRRAEAKLLEVRRQFIAGEIGGRDEHAPLGDLSQDCAYSKTTLYNGFVYVKGNHRLEYGPDLDAAIAAYRAREAAHREALARGEAAKAAEKEAKRQRTLAVLDEEERAMHARGYLDIDAVISRLNGDAVEAVRNKIKGLPQVFTIRVVDKQYSDRKPSTRDEFRLLRHIEQIFGTTNRLVFVPWNSHEDAGVEITTTTADDRLLTLVLGVKIDNDQIEDGG